MSLNLREMLSELRRCDEQRMYWAAASLSNYIRDSLNNAGGLLGVW